MKPIVDRVLPRRRPIIIGVHAGLIVVAYLLAFLLNAEFRVPGEHWRLFLQTLPLLFAIRMAVFYRFHLYEGLWRYVGLQDILTILKAVTLGSLISSAGALGLFGRAFPGTVLLLDWMICLALVGGIRLTTRTMLESARVKGGQREGKRVLIVGAGDAGEMLLREIKKNLTLSYEVLGLVDDDVAKLGRRIHGVEVIGTTDQLTDICRAVDVHELLIAIPSASGAEMRRIIGACRNARVEFKTVPSLGELVDGSFPVAGIRRVNIADLLRRDPVKIDHAEVESFIRGKRVLVTGAGGSIGSELCRQVATFEPEALIMLDRAENNLFFVEMELRQRFPELSIVSVIGDVGDEQSMRALFEAHRPKIVFHAAAHKHVPLMEANKAEAVKNNVLGTITVANSAWRAGVEDFVMISTDKAVRPSSIMGATKRLAEMYVQSLNARIETRFMTVRFGNVLGSEGSVLQIFQKQIEAGGPVTITHPDMKRYFMTIPEASQLVLQSATLGEGGEIFVLDMGEPVRIVDLARDLIALSGLEPEKDIPIKFTGPRPGEKMFEELLNPEVKILPTAHDKIMVVETEPADYDTLQEGITKLLRHAKTGNEPALLAALASLVPDYVTGQSPASPSREKAERILLVEHDAYTRTTMKRILEARYQIVEAENRRQALMRIAECVPSLVILDFHLPGTNIRRLCARLRGEIGRSPIGRDGITTDGGNGNLPAAEEAIARNGRPAIILLAETADVASLNEVLALGADDRLYKPIPVNILETRVRRLLEREKLRMGTERGEAA